MPAISYADWSGGLDLRLPLGIQDANKLYRLQNAYITSGKKIAKRPGLKMINVGLTNTVGLRAIDGRLKVFTFVGGPTSMPFLPLVDVIQLSDYPSGVFTLRDVVWADQFQGFPYVVGKYTDNMGGSLSEFVYRHHYVDGSPSTLVTDANCPHQASVTKAASRIFATAGEVVRFCAIGASRDWTTASDAGFLPTGLQQDSKASCTAVGTFDDALVVFFSDGLQIWDVTEDPSSNQIRRRLYGAGTTYAASLAAFYRDLVFASPYGLRSIAVQENVDRLDESDIGVPIDKLVVPVQAAHQANSVQEVRGVWLQQFGQYWVMYDDAGQTRAFVYSFSKSSKLMCWSEYTFPVLITGVAAIGGKVYARTADALYEMDSDTFVDDGSAPIPVDVQMAFQDAKLPGVEKMFYGADFVFTGTADVSYLYDPRKPSKETNAQSVQGDTRAGGLIPVELTAAAIAPRFRHEANEAFELSLCTLYYHPLSAQAS
jgi:hypothetical protein